MGPIMAVIARFIDLLAVSRREISLLILARSGRHTCLPLNSPPC